MKRLIASNEAETREFAFASNELTVDGEWLRITPWGDFLNKVGLQRVAKEDGDQMVVAFNSFRGRVARAFMGLPIYVGHPDVEPDVYPDKRRYGKIVDLESRADGLYGKIAWNDLGKAAIEQGHYLFNSPSWYLKREKQFVRPVELISVGLTNTPQIRGTPWAKNEPTTESNTMPTWLKELLVAANILKADDDEAAQKTAVNALVKLPARVTELEQQLTTATNEQTRLTGELTATNGKVTELTTKHDTLVTERRKDELDLAVNSGRIAESERTEWDGKLTTNFATNVVDLRGKKPKVATNSKVAGLGGRKGEAPSEKLTAINEAVRLYAAEHKLDLATNDGHNAAFQGAKRKTPALFQ